MNIISCANSCIEKSIPRTVTLSKYQLLDTRSYCSQLQSPPEIGINQRYANSNAKKTINFITFNAFITLNIS